MTLTLSQADFNTSELNSKQTNSTDMKANTIKSNSFKARIMMFAVAFGLITLVLGLSSFKGDRGGAGTRFLGVSWSDVTNHAKYTNKPIFVFIGASYCQRSTRMKAIFRDPEVSKFFNKNFVCKIVDPEQIENNIWASNHGVTHVPAYLFFNSNGKIVHRANDYMKKELIIQEANTALTVIAEAKKAKLDKEKEKKEKNERGRLAKKEKQEKEDNTPDTDSEGN